MKNNSNKKKTKCLIFVENDEFWTGTFRSGGVKQVLKEQQM